MIIKQRLGKLCANGTRIYIEDEKLIELNLTPGKNYEVKIEERKNRVILSPGKNGNTVLTRKKNGKIIPVIDKKGSEIKKALSECQHIKITFYKDEKLGDRVIIEGIKNTAQTIKETSLSTEQEELTCITFCAGAGITSYCNKLAGFKEVAAVEYNPKSGATDRYSQIYSINHPDTVMFNIPMEQLKASDLPYATVWFATLDCTDYSKMASKKKEYKTLHLYMYLMKLFWEKPKEERPLAVLIENVEGFERSAHSLKLCFGDEGYSVTSAKLNSLDYQSRTQRERYFFVALLFDGFTFPVATGRKETPIIEDGVITLENLKFFTPETSATLKYYLDRNDSLKHNHKIKSYDITKDVHVGTIVKTAYNMKPENLIKHPYLENTYAVLNDEKHLKYIHGIPDDYYLGDTKKTVTECVGQGVCVKTYFAIVEKLYKFLKKRICKTGCFFEGDQLRLVL